MSGRNNNKDNLLQSAPQQEDHHHHDQHVFDPVQMIHIRRHGTREHTNEEIQWFIEEFTAGNIPDYQMAAWLMAVCFHPLSERETAALTDCMVQSTPGGPLNWSFLNKNNNNDDNSMNSDAQTPPQPTHLVDKHSTGGVGDKVSIILAPLVACLGVQVPMIAGRGLGHTGGTIDKLESIPGFRTNLGIAEFQQIVQTVGCCINAAGPCLCPADQKLYALRDVTSTVQSVPLQTASIMCKKIAEHPSSLLLDVKYGSGAFQATVQDAAELAHSMVYTGHANGLNPTTAFLTRMDQPLGYAIGNWYEIQECLEILKGGDLLAMEQSYDLIALVCMQAGQMLLQSGLYNNDDDKNNCNNQSTSSNNNNDQESNSKSAGNSTVSNSLHDLTQLAYDTLQQGKALPTFCQMALAQGADPQGVDTLWDPAAGAAPLLYPPIPVLAPVSGRVTAMNTRQLGLLAVELGAGRRMAHEPVDPYAGIWLRQKLGAVVQAGHVLMELYAPPDQAKLDRYDSAGSSSRSSSRSRHGGGGKSLPEQALACITITPVDDDDDDDDTSGFAGGLQPVVTHSVTLDGGVQEMAPNELPAVVQHLYQAASARYGGGGGRNV